MKSGVRIPTVIIHRAFIAKQIPIINIVNLTKIFNKKTISALIKNKVRIMKFNIALKNLTIILELRLVV